MQISVAHYDAKYVPNPNPKGETPFEEFWRVRQAICDVCRRFGTTGPDEKLDYDACYWVIDDQYNDDLYQNMEVYEPSSWNSEWLAAVLACLNRFPGWAISIGNISGGHLLVYADRVLVTGPTFANCHDLQSVVSAARQAAETRARK